MKARMRLFTGLDLPRAVVDGLEQLLGRLRPAARIQWSPPANLHITTKFIGEWPEERLDELKRALGAVGISAPVDIAIRRLGWLPNPRSARMLYAGVEAGEALTALTAATERAAPADQLEDDQAESVDVGGRGGRAAGDDLVRRAIARRART